MKNDLSLIKDEDTRIAVIQEPRYKIWFRKSGDNSSLRILILSNCCQLIAIWIMILLHIVEVCNFSAEEYICNILSFDVVACATNLAGVFGKGESKTKDDTVVKRVLFSNLTDFLIIGIAFTSVLYSLLLIKCAGADMFIRIDLIGAMSIVITLIVTLISLGQAIGR